MMVGIVHGLNCFPNIENKFITWGTGINLYELIASTAQVSPSSTVNELKTEVNFLLTEEKYQYIRCVKTSYYDHPVVAVGLSNGKVGICDFKSINSDIEFVPRLQRTCLCLAWNAYEKNILAIGHDKNRSDYCITIWDTKRGNSKEAFSYIGLSETANSICWDKQNRALLAGISSKSVRQYDLRQSTSTTSYVINTRLVNGLGLSSDGKYVASYLDQTIGLWDVRNVEKPLTQIQIQKNITNIGWCPTRSCVLSAIQRGSPFLHVIDIYSVDIDSGHDLYFTKKNIMPINIKNINHNKNNPGLSRTNTIADISWHPSFTDRALILMESGHITDCEIPQRSSIAWDKNNSLWRSNNIDVKSLFPVMKFSNLTTSTDEDFLNCYSPTGNYQNGDIAETMKKRALVDYGLLADIQINGEVAQEPKLKAVWEMFANMSYDDRINGLKRVLGIDINIPVENIFTLRSEVQSVTWPEFIKNSNILLSYRNETRTKAQLLCGWDFENDMNIFLNKFLPNLCAKKEFTRAAMIAVFFLKINQACEILLKGSDNTNDPSTLRMAAIALSGFDSDHSIMVWKQKQGQASSQIRDPYLRTIFSFLTIENENYDVILNEKGISLSDRIAFSCKYLSDLKLFEYLKITTQKCIQEGDLNGLLLTGESIESIQIMQTYMDMSQDVQTISLLSIRFIHILDASIDSWIQSYLDLLDTWGLFEKRAELESKMNFHNRPNIGKNSRSVFLLCNFCGKSVSAAITEDARKRQASNINKLSSCPNCRKPLPRCSLCLLHMGTTTGISSQVPPDHESLGWQSKPFAKWFSWCQTCRHGGHTDHLQQWFQVNSECPVTGCSCHCFDIDLLVQKFKDI